VFARRQRPGVTLTIEISSLEFLELALLTYLQAVVIGLLQGVTELFPVSSLGHSVLVPAVIGGSWEPLVTQSSTPNSESSFYLAFIVALHVATACALLLFFRSEWVRIIRGFFSSLLPSVQARRIVADDPDSRLAWLIVVATIPVGLTGLLLEHTFRTLFAKPVAAAIFLIINGLILLAGERLRRRAETSTVTSTAAAAARVSSAGTAPAQGSIGLPAGASATGARPVHGARAVLSLSYREALMIGVFQIAALFAGISRSGVSMVGGLLRGLSHEDAARFSFLLATPVIFAAGVLKLPTLAGPATAHIHGQLVVGFVVAGVAAYASVRFLTRYFETRTLTPFAVYSLVAGVLCLIRFSF
jgi:undecaprenyl-diphosphatase